MQRHHQDTSSVEGGAGDAATASSRNTTSSRNTIKNEGHPLLMHHISFTQKDSFSHEHYDHQYYHGPGATVINRWLSALTPKQRVHWGWGIILFVAACLATLLLSILMGQQQHPKIIPIEKAVEHRIYIEDYDGELSLWYRTWGNRQSGIPVLFVHGGPGNSMADYGNRNARFFNAKDFFVIEADQRGTGHSQPSVQADCHNLKYYKNITIGQMSNDYELIRQAVGIEKWLVFGGSWGSTLSLDYATRYPSRCLGLIVRGVWLNTPPEFDAIFTRQVYRSNPKWLSEFDTWFELSAKAVQQQVGQQPPLDPNDAERFFRVSGKMIQQCDANAIWRHFVWEFNMMEEDPAKHLDPFHIDKNILPEATSVAFFENRLYLDGTYDNPSNLLAGVHNLKSMNVWICQGLRDMVCPAKYGARKLMDALLDAKVATRAQFLDAGHEDTDPEIAKCLKDSTDQFLSTQQQR